MKRTNHNQLSGPALSDKEIEHLLRGLGFTDFSGTSPKGKKTAGKKNRHSK